MTAYASCSKSSVILNITLSNENYAFRLQILELDWQEVKCQVNFLQIPVMT